MASSTSSLAITKAPKKGCWHCQWANGTLENVYIDKVDCGYCKITLDKGIFYNTMRLIYQSCDTGFDAYIKHLYGSILVTNQQIAFAKKNNVRLKVDMIMMNKGFKRKHVLEHFHSWIIFGTKQDDDKLDKEDAGYDHPLVKLYKYNSETATAFSRSRKEAPYLKVRKWKIRRDPYKEDIKTLVKGSSFATMLKSLDNFREGFLRNVNKLLGRKYNHNEDIVYVRIRYWKTIPYDMVLTCSKKTLI